MSTEINPLSDLLEHHRALLEEADTDIEIANNKHREAMARLTQERDTVNATHQQALNDAVARKFKAEGAIAALEELAAQS
jgi:hypothetical protein